MDYNTFNEAFEDLDRICKRNFVQKHTSQFDACFEPRQVKVITKIIDKIKATPQIGKYTLTFDRYYDYRNRFEFDVKDPNGRSYSKDAYFPLDNMPAFFPSLVNAFTEVERCNFPSLSYSDFNLDAIAKCKSILTDMENDLNQAIGDVEKLKKDLALDMFMFQKLPSRRDKRNLAWEKRCSKINGLKNELKRLWIQEHPLQAGSEIVYRYVYNGYEHGERKPGTIASINGTTVTIHTAKGRIITKDLNDVFREGNSKYECSNEYRMMQAALTGEAYKPVEQVSEDEAEAMAS